MRFPAHLTPKRKAPPSQVVAKPMLMEALSALRIIQSELHAGKLFLYFLRAHSAEYLQLVPQLA